MTKNKFWSCRPSLESEDYDGGDEPRKPWRGILVKHSEDKPGEVWFLHSFNEETGEIDDDDPNAYALVTKQNLFDTEAEAKEHYRKLCYDYGHKLLNEAQDWFAEATRA